MSSYPDVVKTAKMLALAYGVKVAMQYAIEAGALTGTSATGSYRRRSSRQENNENVLSMAYPGGYDPLSEGAIWIGVFVIFNHAGLLGRDGNFWSDVAWMLASWYAVQRFPKDWRKPFQP
jgi:hypothetical protein